MNKIIRAILEIIIPIFTAWMCMYGVIGIYLTYGGKLEDKVGFMFFPIIISMVYGGYVGYKAFKKTEK